MNARARSSITSLALMGLVLSLPGPASAGPASPEVEAAVARDGAADVIVNLVTPPPAGPLGSAAAMADRQQAVRAAQGRVLAKAPARDLSPRHRYKVVPALSARVTAAGLAALRDDPAVESVELDVVGEAALADTVPQIGGDVLHGIGLTGTGTTVAVLDSGIDTDHPDLADSLVAEECFCSLDPTSLSDGMCCPNGQTTQSGPGAAEDDFRHGTWVTGIIASNGVVAPVGVAPDAAVLALKVINRAGWVRASDTIAALDWIGVNQPGTAAVNMSLCFLENCPTAMRNAVATLTANDTAVFAATGNQGSTAPVCSPASCEGVIGVGAVDKTDVVEDYSNSGPVVDVLAPGTNIVTTGLAGGTRTVTFGTSFAAPHAAGAAVLLRQAYPNLTPSDLLAILQHTGVPLTDVPPWPW